MNIVKMIKSENNNGFISPETFNTKTMTFNIDLPVNAVVDHIRINGSFTVNEVEQVNRLIEDIEAPLSIVYHRELAYQAYNPERMQRATATVYFHDGIPADLLSKVQSGQIDSFDVYYHEEAVSEIE